MSRRAVVFLTILLAGASACGTYSVRRAALVPKLQPSQRNGQPMGRAAAEVSAGTAGLVHFYEPQEVKGANAGIAVPRSQVHAAARFQTRENFDIGVIWDHGFDEGSIAVSEDQPDPEGDVMGGGVSLYYAAETSNPRLSVGVGADLLLYSIPYIEYRTCAADCVIEPFTLVDKDRDLIPVVSLAILPSYRLIDKWNVFGGVTLRNHPTIPKQAIEGPLDGDEEVEPGPMNYILSAGIEREIGAGVRAMLVLSQPVSPDPVQYGPVLGFNVTLPIGNREPPQQPLAPPPPGGPPPPPPGG